MRQVLARLLDLYALVTAGWLLAWKLFRDRWGLLGMLNAWAFWLLSTGLPIGTVRLWQRSRWLAGGWVALLAAIRAAPATRSSRQLTFRPHSPQQRRVVSTAGVPLHLLSFNLLKHNEEVAPFVATIRAESPDLVLFQELTPVLAEHLENRLADDYPYRFWAPGHGASGLGIVSLHPFAISGLWRYPGFEPFTLRATLSLPGGPLDIYVVHLVAPAGDHLLETGVTGNFRLREAQASHLVDEVERCGRSAILMGDYNMSDSNEAYRIFTARLNDAWTVAGRGLGWTWPRNFKPFLDLPILPVLRLDYCFHTEGVVPQEVRVLHRETASDHCPLSARVRVL